MDKKLKDWTSKELIDRAQGLHCSIFQSECYGSKDLLLYDMIVGILAARGYELVENKSISFVKEG